MHCFECAIETEVTQHLNRSVLLLNNQENCCRLTDTLLKRPMSQTTFHEPPGNTNQMMARGLPSNKRERVESQLHSVWITWSVRYQVRSLHDGTCAVVMIVSLSDICVNCVFIANQMLMEGTHDQQETYVESRLHICWYILSVRYQESNVMYFMYTVSTMSHAASEGFSSSDL
jgi:hypothetical protein